MGDPFKNRDRGIETAQVERVRVGCAPEGGQAKDRFGATIAEGNNDVAEMDCRAIANGKLESCVQPAGCESKTEAMKMQKVRTDPFMKYQLILQWPASSIKDFDSMIEIEEVIIEGLNGIGKVDGHDAGSGEMNVFIFTDDPKLAFERIERILGTKDFMPDLKAAYREVGKDEFTILYPAGLSHFAIA